MLIFSDLPKNYFLRLSYENASCHGKDQASFNAKDQPIRYGSGNFLLQIGSDWNVGYRYNNPKTWPKSMVTKANKFKIYRCSYVFIKHQVGSSKAPLYLLAEDIFY